MTKTTHSNTPSKTHTRAHTRRRATLGKRGDGGQWPYLVAMILGLLALLFFAWIIIRARASDQSIFDQLSGVVGIGICLGRHRLVRQASRPT